MIPMTGDHFGPYEILGTLGRGGVGEVYRAWDGRLEREVALKLLHDEYPQPGNRERFLIEARAASALNHANICTIFDMGQKDGWPYLVMELLKGITLKQRIERSGMSAEEIVRVGAEVAGALGAAHALGIIHRDIKPANVMLTRQTDGKTRVKVLDFGLAKLTGPLPGQLNHHEEHLTVVGEAVGTVSYMSPEQARGEELDGRSDLFSLGVVMYEMATRRTPFHGATTALLFAHLLGRDPEPIREWNDAIPRALEKVIFRLLEKDPVRRYREASEVVEALEQVSAKLAGSRWRRASSPAVPLVRVEEPVARPELPVRPEFLREQAKVAHASSARVAVVPMLEEARAVPVERPVEEPRAVEAELRPVAVPSSRVRLGSGSGAAHEARQKQKSSGTSVRQGFGGGPEALRNKVPQVIRSGSSSQVSLAPAEEPKSAPDADVDEAPAAAEGVERVRPTWAGGHFLRVADPAEYEAYVEEDARGRDWRRRMWVAGGVAAAVLCTAGALFKVRAAGSHGTVLAQSDGVMVTAVENHTGVQTLDGSIAEGLEFQLAQTEALTVRSVGEFRTTVHAIGSDDQPVSQGLARQAAEAAGAKAFVYGEVREGEQGAHGTGVGFLLHVGVFDTAAGRELISAEARAARTQDFAGAIDEIAQELVQGMAVGAGSRGSDAGRKQVPLAREATGSLNALHAYSVGVQAEAEGRRMAALRSFSLAAGIDRSFVQAQVQVAWLGREAGAEVASAQAALRAKDASPERSARTVLLAEIAGELIGRGDTERAMIAAKTLLQENAQDVAARVAMVRVLRAAGQNEEAARLGQEAVTAGGRDGELYRETELALIALDRYDAALALEDRAGKQAVAHPEIALEAGYLAGREDRVTSALATIGKMTEDAVLLEQARAVYLDNTGAAAEGRATWSDAARTARVQPGLSGAGELMLAKAALNRAFTGECSVATQLARVAASRAAAGPEARADAALAGALCGDSELAGESKNDARVRAAVSMAQGEPEAAALALTGLRDGGTEPVTQFLKGMSHLQSGNAQAAVQDFQAIVKHRGSSYETGIDLGPAAQLKLARAFAEAGERSRSMEAYRDFLKLWDAAGAGDRLRVEAAAGARGSLPVGEPAVPPVQMANARTGEQQRRPVSDRPRVKSYFPTPAWLMPSDGGAGSSGQGVGAAKAMPAGGKSPRDASGTTIE